MLDRILKRADFLDGSTFSADEVARWPLGALDHLLAVGLIREIAPADGLVCDECEEACWIKPEPREDPRTGKRVGRYFCRTNEDLGPFTVDLERLRQWEVSSAGLSEAVARAISATGGVQAVVPDRVYWLGRVVLEGKSREVFFCRGLAWSDGAAVLAQAKRLTAAKASIVIVPAVPPPEESWNGREPTVRPLTEIASLTSTGLAILMEHLVEAETGGGGKGGLARTGAKAKKPHRAATFALDVKRQRAQVGDNWHDLTDRQTQALSVLKDARGVWVEGRNCGERMDKIVRDLPAPVRRLVGSKKGPNGGYRLNPDLFK